MMVMGGDERVFFVYGGLGVLGSEVAEQLLARGDAVIVCDDQEAADEDVVNGATIEEKRSTLARLSRFGKLRFVRWRGTTEHLTQAAAEATDVLLFGLCGRKDDGGSLAYAALGGDDDRGSSLSTAKVAVVASSAAVYDTSFGGGRRGGSSARTHTRPLLSESDARFEADPIDPRIASTWRVEDAVFRACPPGMSGRGGHKGGGEGFKHNKKGPPKVAVLRYFGVFGGRDDFAKRLVARMTRVPAVGGPEDDGESSCSEDFLGMKRLGAYGCADFCGVSDAADAAVRTIDSLHNDGLPGATAINVGVGRAHRAEHVCRAVAKALATLGLGLGGDDQKTTVLRRGSPPFLFSETTSTTTTKQQPPPPVVPFGGGGGSSSPKRLLASKLSKSCPTGLNSAGGDARAGFAAADVSKLRALVGWVPNPRLDVALAKELAKASIRGEKLIDLLKEPDVVVLLAENKSNDHADSPPPSSSPRGSPTLADQKRPSATPASLLSSGDEGEPFYPKNRSLAALDLSSCAATNLLQVSVKDGGRDFTPARPSPWEKDDNNETHPQHLFARTHRKNHRFFQLNQFTAIPLRSDTAKDKQHARTGLNALFAPVEA